MKKFLLLSYLLLAALAMQAQSKNQAYLDYIAQYTDLAIAQQRKHKVPAAITMAQGI